MGTSTLLAVATGTTFGFAGNLWWLFDLFAHFRLYLLAAAVLVTLGAVLLRSRRAAALGALAVIANGAAMQPLFVAGPPPEGEHRLTVLLVNVERENGHFDAIARLIDAQHPDLVALVEPDQRWLSALDAALSGLPYRVQAPRGDNFGLALYSRYPLRSIERDAPGGFPALRAVIDTPAGRLPLMLVHPPPPLGAELSAARDATFVEIARWAATQPEAVVLGDFNATLYSAPFQAMLGSADLRVAAAGQGIVGTWPAPLGALGILIDHVLLRGGWRVVDFAVGPLVGSDHRPVSVALGR